METVDLDMEDVFGGSLEEEGELQMPADLPELDDDDGPMAAGNEEDQNEDENVLANIKNLSKGAAKRKVLKPQPKLDGDRLRSSRGLPALTKLFEDVKFKGKGHEASDLKLMMGRLEHWAHRLFPKMPFDDFIIRMERLGNKRDVKTCIKRIRLDMPLLEEDFVEGDPEENAEPVENEPNEMDAEAAFEEMLAQERELQSRREKIQDDEDEFDFFDGAPSATSTQSSQLPISNSPNSQKVKSNSQSSGIEDGVSDPQSRLCSHEIPSKQTVPTTPEATPIKSQATPTQQTGTPSTGSTMPATPVSCDQRQRMEANKLAALKKRAARMGVPVETLMSPSKPLSPATSQQQTTPEEQGGASSELHTNAPSLDEANL